MSKKEVDESKLHFVPAKKVEPPKGKTTYLDGVEVNKKPNSQLPFNTFYAEGGKEVPDGKGVFAKKVTHPEGRCDYFIKFATCGGNVNKIINPWGMYFVEGDEIKYEKHLGRNKYEYRRVDEEVFKTFVKFLETRNTRYLLVAERETLSG